MPFQRSNSLRISQGLLYWSHVKIFQIFDIIMFNLRLFYLDLLKDQ